MKIIPQGINTEEFENAFKNALALYENISIENSKRTRLLVSIAFAKGEHLLDVGSYINIYPVVLRLLGMKITIIDSFPQRRLPGESEKINYVIENVYKKVGINVIQEDVYDVSLGKNVFDHISAFEIFEHLVDSPRPILEKLYSSLRSGGKIIISVPNILSLAKRLKALCGKSPLPDFKTFFENGNPFTGHRREMTTDEMRLMINMSGFKLEHIFTTNIVVPTLNKEPFLKKLYHFYTDFSLLPTNLRKSIFAIARKPLY